MTWRNVLMAIFGAWFVVSAWAFHPIKSVWTAVILGGLILIGSVWALFDREHRAWRYWLEALFGLYLGLTPFFYGLTSHAGVLWVTMIGGAATTAGGLWNALTHRDSTESHPTNRAA